METIQKSHFQISFRYSVILQESQLFRLCIARPFECPSHVQGMRLFLIRHGETVDNVAGVYAGITDSALTTHGVLQANQLGQYLAATDVKVCSIFSSDLARAFKTAEAVRLAQPKQATIPLETKQLALLREQDFGSLERKSFHERSSDSKKAGKELHSETKKSDANFKDVETQEAMRARSNRFIDEHLVELIYSVRDDSAVVVVAHGIILAHLWRCILRQFAPTAVSVAPGAVVAGRALALEHLGIWANTGYMELEILPRNSESPITTSLPAAKAPELAPLGEAKTPTNDATGRKILDLSLVVKAVNSLEHLKGLRKTRGGIGSSKYDEDQKTIESFFKKRKIVASPQTSFLSPDGIY